MNNTQNSCSDSAPIDIYADNPTVNIDYQLAVMTAAKNGAKVQYRHKTDGVWLGGVTLKESGCTSAWDWSCYIYRILPKPKVAEGNNPEHVTEEQLGLKEGYRLLSVEEVQYLRKFPSNYEVYAFLDKQYKTNVTSTGIELYDNGGGWIFNCQGGKAEWTYRTKNVPDYYLPKPVIAEGNNPKNLTEDLVGVKDGWRLLTKEEIESRKWAKVIQSEDIFMYASYRDSLWSVRARGTSLTNTYRTLKPAGYFLAKPKQHTVNLVYLKKQDSPYTFDCQNATLVVDGYHVNNAIENAIKATQERFTGYVLIAKGGAEI